MKKNPTRSQMNKTIHEFMKGKWTIVANTPGGHLSILDFTSTSFDKCAQLAKDENKIRKEKYKVVPKLSGYQYHYHYSYDAIMPVVKKIAELILTKNWKNLREVTEKYKPIYHAFNPEKLHIKDGHKAVYEFADWYNKSQSK